MTRPVPQDVLALLAAEADLLAPADGPTLIRKGDEGDSLYLVVSGAVLVTSSGVREGPPVESGARRSATVVARGATRVIRLFHGGTSMGSIMAGGYAMGLTWQQLIQLVSVPNSWRTLISIRT